MPRHLQLVALPLAPLAALLVACSDVAAPALDDTLAPRFADGLKTGQCFLQVGLSATQVAPDASGDATVAAPAGEVVTRVAIKAGTECFLTPEGATGTYAVAVDGTPCYAVSGLGAASATVTRVGGGPACKDISHVEYVSGPPPAGGGQLRICKAITFPELGFLFEPVTYLVAGTLVTLPAKLYPERPDALTCAEPIELPVGEYAVTEQPTINLAGVVAIATDPDDRFVAYDPAAWTATVRVVGGMTTTVTFISGWGDHHD